MSLRPARQEKTTSKKKRLSKREPTPTTQRTGNKRTPSEVAKASPTGTASEETERTALTTASPVFVRRDLTGPDGSVRAGWEMWIGNHCFGRADSKELLLASFERLQSPPSSFHWREVRNRMPMRNRPKGIQAEAEDPREERESPWGWGKKEEEPLLEEAADGFQELSWDTTA